MGAKRKRAMPLVRTTCLLVRCIVPAFRSLLTTSWSSLFFFFRKSESSPNLICLSLDVGWVTEVSVSCFFHEYLVGDDFDILI